MTFRWTFALFLAATVVAQEPHSKADLLSLADQIQIGIQTGNWKRAAELSAGLKEALIAQRNRSLSGEAKEQIDRVLKWLPQDTETVIVSQEPFTLPQPNVDPPLDALAEARQYSTFLLFAALPEKNLGGRTLKFALVGARKFQQHEPLKNDALPLGLIAYEGCGVYALAQPVDESVLQPFQSSILGHPVRESKAQEQNPDAKEVETSYASLLRPDLMIACNNRDFLTQVLSRMDGPPAAEAFPSSLVEWKYVNGTKPLWAMRHFRPQRAEQDPTYPGNGLISDQKISTPVGVVLDADASETISARFISGPEVNPWKDIAEAGDFKGLAKTKQLSPTVWELSVSDDKEVGTFAIFALMAMLGFAVLV